MIEGFCLVDSEEKLLEAASEWSSASELGVDLECENCLHYYGVYISLIQVSSSGKHWVVDVLKLKDVDPLIKVFSDPNVKKIFHDVSFDFRILNYQFSCRPKNIFDSQVAAAFCGFKELGLAPLLERFFGVRKETKFQMADWTARPLSNDLLSYAIKDTMYLIHLKDVLCGELARLGRLPWVEEECGLLESREWVLEKPSFDGFRGYSSLSDSERGVLRELFLLREKLAEQVNRPPYYVIRGHRLAEFVVSPPKSIEAWASVRGVHPVVRRKAHLFHEAVARGRKNPIHLHPKKRNHFSAAQHAKLEELSVLRSSLSEKLSIPPHLLLSKDQMVEVASSGGLDCLRGWQRSVLFEGAGP